jgi:hypothetical protein
LKLLPTSSEKIIFYLNQESKIHIYLKNIIELLSLKYEVIVIGRNLYNIKINGVTYVSINDMEETESFLLKIIKKFNINKIYTDNYNILLYVNVTEKMELNYIMNDIPNLLHYKNKLYKNNGIEYMRNTYHLFKNIYFFNKALMKQFQDHLNLNEMSSNFQLNSYVFKKNENQKKLGVKKPIILSIDKHPQRVINSFKIWNKKMNNKFNLILLNNNINQIESEYIKVYKNNIMNFTKYLDESYFYITFENQPYTYSNILIAINHYCIPIIPKIYQEFNNKFITFNGFLNKYNLIDMGEIYENSQKKIIYNNLCESIIKNHLKNMKW